MPETKIQHGMIRGIIPSPYDERDIHYAFMPEKVERPDAFSLRKQQTPVRDQGAIGSCAAFAGCAVSEFLYKGETILSPRHLYCARANAPQEGMVMRDVCKIMQKQGVCTEKCWEYLAHKSLCKTTSPCVGCVTEALQYRIGEYSRVYGSIKDALYTNQTPLFACIPIYEGFPSIFGKMLGYHAVVITGYSNNLLEFKNSWGLTWHDNGYGYFEDTYPTTEAWVLKARKEEDIPGILIGNAVVGNTCFWGLPVKIRIISTAAHSVSVRGGWTWTHSLRKGINNITVYISPKIGTKPFILDIASKSFRAYVTTTRTVSDWVLI